MSIVNVHCELHIVDTAEIKGTGVSDDNSEYSFPIRIRH